MATSLLPAAGAAGLRAVGLHPVGLVMGCTVQSIGRNTGPDSRPNRYRNRRAVTFRPYVDALRQGYGTALRRMTAEANAVGADGVVGVRLTHDHRKGVGHEFVALGTAVRADSTHRPRNPFSTDLPGQDVAKLMLAGWVPVRIAVGVAVESCYVSNMNRPRILFLGNTEIASVTQLVNGVRDSARRSFTQRAQDIGADGALVTGMELRQWFMKLNNTEVLCMAAVVFGTAIARFAERRPVETLTIMPLGRR